MTEALNVQLDEVVRLKWTDASAVLGEARLRGELTSAQAVERLGEPLVARADAEWQAVRDDVAWGLHGRE